MNHIMRLTSLFCSASITLTSVNMERIGTIFHTLDTQTQCAITADILTSDASMREKESVMRLLLGRYQLGTSRQLKNPGYLQENMPKVKIFASILSTLLEHKEFQTPLPVRPLYKFLNNGEHSASQKTLRIKLYNYSELSPEQIDLFVYLFTQELVKFDRDAT